jgi:hypothetical protein
MAIPGPSFDNDRLGSPYRYPAVFQTTFVQIQDFQLRGAVGYDYKA